MKPKPLTTHYSLQTRQGFTLLELLVVITLIGVLTAITVVSYSQFLKQARVAKRKADLQEIRMALEMYRANNSGLYPETTSSSYPCNGWWCGSCSNYGSLTTSYIPGLASQYMQKLPHDPKEGVPNNLESGDRCLTGGEVCYVYRSTGVDYKLVANCGAEIAISSQDPFYDTVRSSYSLQISTTGAVGW